MVFEGFSHDKRLGKGRFSVNFPRAVAELEAAMKKFPIKRILYRMIFRGKGLEFDSYRVFENDDDAELIDWRASLRSNQLMARKYIEEKDLHVYFLVDASSSMLFGSGKVLKAEYAAETVAALSHLVLSAGDRIGLILFNEKVSRSLHPGSGRNHYALFSKFLSDPLYYGGGFSLEAAIEHALRLRTSQYTVFVIVSDFIRTSKRSERALKLMGSKFETLAVMVRDPMDEKLPNTSYQYSIEDPYTGRQMILDPKIAAGQYHHNAIHQKIAVKEMLKKSGIDLLEINTNERFIIPLASFLKARVGRGTK